MAFLHGIEHIDLEADFAPVNTIFTAVIGLIGTSSGSAAHNELTLCLSEKDDAKFGSLGTIPDALKAIRLQASKRDSAIVIVI